MPLILVYCISAAAGPTQYAYLTLSACLFGCIADRQRNMPNSSYRHRVSVLGVHLIRMHVGLNVYNAREVG